MIARPESWSRPAEAPSAALLLVALAVLAGSWGLLHRGFYTRDQVVDTPVYQSYGDAIANGEVPYRDFRVEYPPGALPVFVLPALGHDEAGDSAVYRRVFEWLMLACAAAALVFVGLTLRALAATPVRLAAALGFVALSPLALGSVVLTRFDLWPAALAAAALAALVAGRDRLGFGVLGLGTTAKIYPVLLLPLALAYVWRRRGLREARLCGGIFAAVVAAVFLPFVILSPGGVGDSLGRQLSRPLQIESLGSSFLLAAHQVFDLEITMRSGHGSQNLAGTLPIGIAVLITVLQAAVLIGIWAWFARGPADRERLVLASAAVVVAFVAFGKVLSPQFLLWLVPLVALVGGRRGLVAGTLLAAALVLTQLWFPFRYWKLALDFDQTASWLVLARDLVLVGVLAALAWPRGRLSSP